MGRLGLVKIGKCDRTGWTGVGNERITDKVKNRVQRSTDLNVSLRGTRKRVDD